MEKRQPRSELIYALAKCIESLCQFALMETGGAIRTAIETDDRVWDWLGDDYIAILDEGLGITREDE